MSAASFISLGFLILILLVAIGPLGRYMAKVYSGGRAPGDRVFAPIERLIYRILRIDPDREQRWNVYTLALLAFSAVSVLGLYFFERIQTWLPLNNGMANVLVWLAPRDEGGKLPIHPKRQNIKVKQVAIDQPKYRHEV